MKDRSVEIFQKIFRAFIADHFCQFAALKYFSLTLYRRPDTDQTVDIVLLQQLCHLGIQIHIAPAALQDIR